MRLRLLQSALRRRLLATIGKRLCCATGPRRRRSDRIPQVPAPSGPVINLNRKNGSSDAAVGVLYPAAGSGAWLPQHIAALGKLAQQVACSGGP